MLFYIEFKIYNLRHINIEQCIEIYLKTPRIILQRIKALTLRIYKINKHSTALRHAI